jgi:hypothetical protein
VKGHITTYIIKTCIYPKKFNMKWAPTLEFLNGPYHGDFKVTICKLDPKIKVKIF